MRYLYKLLSKNQVLLFLVFPISLTAQQLDLHVNNPNSGRQADVNIKVNGKTIGKTNQNGAMVINYEQFKQPLNLQISHSGYLTIFHSVSPDTLKQPLNFILQGKNDLDEIVVTASRKPEHISTVPSSISILTSKEIEAQSQINTNISNILGNSIPGLGVSSNKATNTGQTLRGRSVLVLIDGIPQSTPLMNGARDIRSIDPSVIERVEVI